MFIVKFKKGDATWYKPHTDNDPTFLHCADGFVEVAEHYFENHLKSVFRLHKVKIEILDQDEVFEGYDNV